MSPIVHLAALALLLPAALPKLALAAADREPLVMVVQPINSEQTTLRNYQPLADYLARGCGCEIDLQTVGNYLSFWGMTRRGDFDLALDAAHTTSYRVASGRYQVIAKVNAVVSYSVVTRDDGLFIGIDELVGRRIATLPSPGLGAIRLLEMFPGATRLPVMVSVENSQEAVRALMEDRVAAAVIPTPLVGAYDGLSVVATTDPVPSPAISVSSRVNPATAVKLRRALLMLQDSEQGRQVLATARVSGFELAENAEYEGYHTLLNGVWGYDVAASAP